jgi:hypothetical protein
MTPWCAERMSTDITRASRTAPETLDENVGLNDDRCNFHRAQSTQNFLLTIRGSYDLDERSGDCDPMRR